MTQVTALALMIFLLTSCRGDMIHCAKLKPDKVRHSTVNRSHLKKRIPSPSSIETIRDKNAMVSRREINKKPSDAENWDCPRPGKQNQTKILKVRNKKIEKEKNEIPNHLHPILLYSTQP